MCQRSVHINDDVVLKTSKQDVTLQVEPSTIHPCPMMPEMEQTKLDCYTNIQKHDSKRSLHWSRAFMSPHSCELLINLHNRLLKQHIVGSVILPSGVYARSLSSAWYVQNVQGKPGIGTIYTGISKSISWCLTCSACQQRVLVARTRHMAGKAATTCM